MILIGLALGAGGFYLSGSMIRKRTGEAATGLLYGTKRGWAACNGGKNESMKVLMGKKVLWNKVKPANTAVRRLVGLLNTPVLEPDEGLLIWPCKQVHTFHMKYAIDVVFIDKNMRVLDVVTMEPGKIGSTFKTARYVLEVTAGQARLYGIKASDVLVFENDVVKK